MIEKIKTPSVAFVKYVATLTLGWQPKQGLVRVRNKREAREAHLIFSGV